MAVSVKHAFVSPVPDEGDPTKAGPNEWNAEHSVWGLGSAAEADVIDFATAAQGALADTAVQPGEVDALVSANADVAANTAARHAAITVTDSAEINFTLVGQDITASLIAASIDETKLDASVNASLDLADSALQSAAIANMLETGDIGVSVQAYDAELASWAGVTRASGVDTFVASPSSANLRALLGDETGTGGAVFATSPTLTTPTVNSETNTGAQQLSVSPTGNTTATQTSLTVQGTTAQASKREFLANFGLISTLGNGLGTPTEDKVTLYAGVQGQSGTGAIWAGNFLTRMDASSGSYSAHGIEIDLDNLNAHRGDASLAAPSIWGLNISGASTFRSTGAILVSGAADQWNRGITFANDTIVQATFQDLCNADISLDIQGSHVTGLDLHLATISGDAVSLGTGHSIGWNSGDVTIVHSGNQLTFAGAETAYSFESDEDNGTTTARILNNSDAATITKLTALQFSGRDTTNALKETARIEVAPPNDNWVGADMRMYVRAGSGEAVTEVLRLGSDLSVKAVHPTGGVGYGTGAGGTVTQATSKSTGVTLNKVTGQITMNAAALAANAEVTFTLTNSAIAAADILVVNHSLTAKYVVNAVSAAGSAAITVRNVTAGSLSEALVIKYAVVKAATT